MIDGNVIAHVFQTWATQSWWDDVVEEIVKADVYGFWFGLIQVIVLVGGIAAGVLSLASARRARRSESLLRVLAELDDEDFTKDVRTVISAFPAREGSLEHRVRVLVGTTLSTKEVDSARLVVERLNNMVHQVELNLFRERELLRTAHPRIIDVAYRLEPFIMIASAQRAHAWGWRVRRLLVGAIRYYQRSPAYKDDSFLDPHGEKGIDGELRVWFEPISPRWNRSLQALLYGSTLRRRLIPTRSQMQGAYARERETVAKQLADIEASGVAVQRYDIF